MPVWSADGKTVAYTSTRRVITRTLGGAADARGPIRTWSRHLHLSSWSPDGHWFAAYDYEPTANENVWALSSDGRDSLPVAVTPAQELNAVFSPNGKWVAYQSNESGRFEIYVVSFPKLDVKRQVSVSGGRIPRWDASGTALYFLRADTLMTVPVRADAGFEIAGSPASLFSTAAFDYDVAPDGRSFLLEVPNPNAPALPLHVVMNALGHR
jgi:Tol biopolymer transport system component